MATQRVAANLRNRWLRLNVAILVSVVAAAAAWADSARTQEREQVFLPGEAHDQRLQCGDRLESQVKEAEYLAAGTSAPADPLCKLSPEVAALPPIGPCQVVNPQMTCEVCLERFVQELDGLLAGKPHSVMDLDVLSMRTLRLKACNVEEALKIARKSRYFTSLFERVYDYGIAFSATIVLQNVAWYLAEDDDGSNIS